MKERPILFSAPMVRALLAGTKTQTRRVVKPQPHRIGWYTQDDKPGVQFDWHEVDEYGDPLDSVIRCPYGVPGDRLYVREVYYQLGHWEPVAGQVTRKGNRQKWRFVVDSDEIRFDAPPEFRKGRHSKDPGASVWHKRLARFMPRAASRLTLEVTDVRVERVQSISTLDAMAEGAAPKPVAGGTLSYTHGFRVLWDNINNRPWLCWDDNPWVWVVTFKVVKP